MDLKCGDILIPGARVVSLVRITWMPSRCGKLEVPMEQGSLSKI